MRVGHDVENGFEILSEAGDMIGAAYRDARTGRIDVNPAAAYGGLDPLPMPDEAMQRFAEVEFRRRDQAAGRP